MVATKIKLAAVALAALVTGVLVTVLATSAPAHHQKVERYSGVVLTSCGVHASGRLTDAGNWSVHATWNPCDRAYRAWANFECYYNGFGEGVVRIGQAYKGTYHYSYAHPNCPSSLPYHYLIMGAYQTYHDGGWQSPVCIVGCPVAPAPGPQG